MDRWNRQSDPRRTIRQVLERDKGILRHATEILQSQIPSRMAVPRNHISKVIAKLFDDAEKTAGGLDRFLHLVEKDHEKDSRELKEFKAKLQTFDEDHQIPGASYATDSCVEPAQITEQVIK